METHPDDGSPSASWEFRFAIEPTRQNAIKAAHALAKLPQFKADDHPGIKIYIPAENADLSGWDGTIAGGDRDQRGKEICVYMDHLVEGYRPAYYEGEYPHPDYLKNLMLDMWKALQDAGVEMAYIAPNLGERAIPVIDSQETVVGFSPIMYCSFKPFRQRNGLLHERDYNPTHQQDPLETVKITSQNLSSKKIKPITFKQIEERQVRQLEHYHRGIQRVTAELSSTTERLGQYTDLVAQLNSLMCCNPDSDQFKPLVDILILQLEPLRGTNFCPFPASMIEEEKNYFEDCLTALKQAKESDNVRLLWTPISQLMKNIATEEEISVRDLEAALLNNQMTSPGKFILEAKFRENPEKFQKMIQVLELLHYEKLANDQDVAYLAAHAKPLSFWSSFFSKKSPMISSTKSQEHVASSTAPAPVPFDSKSRELTILDEEETPLTEVSQMGRAKMAKKVEPLVVQSKPVTPPAHTPRSPKSS